MELNLSQIIQLGVASLGLLVSVPFMLKVRRLVPDGQISNSELTQQERKFIWILSIISPIFTNAVLYYGWNKYLPVKAKQSNKISWQGAFIGVAISLGVATLITLGLTAFFLK